MLTDFNSLTLTVDRVSLFSPRPAHKAHLDPGNKPIMQQIHCGAGGAESLPKEPSESKLILNAPLSRTYIHGNYKHTAKRKKKQISSWEKNKQTEINGAKSCRGANWIWINSSGGGTSASDSTQSVTPPCTTKNVRALHRSLSQDNKLLCEGGIKAGRLQNKSPCSVRVKQKSETNVTLEC